ncbi:MAG: tripartite tricarboxylate transporter substrate binding protein [Burkholderiales bacterium]|jgi:tripartite-type tricarboxylate transporter receptor subunit TctC|nr:tripartite tricarboxylate transporter substrate binding protein [Burkholderiales bacterium]
MDASRKIPRAKRRPARRTALSASAALALCVLPSATFAQGAVSLPAKQIRVIVALAPGGGTDVVTRIVAARLTDIWGTPVVVENRAGGGQIIGTEFVARAPADGATLLAITPAHVINATLHEKLPYRWDRDFVPIVNMAATANVLVVHPSLPVKTTKELIALVRSRPGQMHYGSSGVGGASHLAFELFNSMAKLDVVHVPYKGGPPAVQDVLAGQIYLLMGNMPSVLQHIRSGRMRPLAIASSRRSPLLPELPTVAESALPGYEASNWNGLVAPAGTPQDLVTRYNADVVRVVTEPAIRDRLSSGGFDPIGDTPTQFSAYLKTEFQRWATVIRARGIKVD